MKKIAIIVGLCLCARGAVAITPYFSAGGSVGIGGGDGAVRSGGFAGAFGVRYKVADINMRTELEYNNLIYDKEYKYAGQTYDYDLKTQLYLVNVLADIYGNGMRSGLHLGVTAGVADYKRDLPKFLGGVMGDKTSFIYGASAGVGIYMLAGLYADVGVRYLRTMDDDGIDSLSPYFTIRYGF